MAFVLTLLYVVIALVSPSVLPTAIMNLHVNEILGVLVILALLPRLPEAKLGTIPETYFVFGVFIAAVMSIIASGWWSHVLDAVIGFLPIVFGFFFVLVTCQSLPRLKLLIFLLMCVGVFIFSQGAIADHAHDLTSEYMFAETNETGSVVYRYRGLGVLADPNDLAQLFTMTIPLLFLFWKKGKFVRNFCFSILPAATLAVAVYFTHSRGGVVALVAVLLFGFKDKLGVVKSSILTAVVFAGLMALNITGGRGMNNDDGGRIAAWITGLEVFKSHPLFGIGIGNFGEYNDTGSTAHNSYILALAELGMFGYFFWMGSIVAAWRGLSQIIRSKVVELAPAGSLGHKALQLASPTEARVRQWIQPPSLTRITASPASGGATLALGYQSALVRPASAPSWASNAMTIGKSALADKPTPEEDLIRAAKIFRVALVGLLTSSFFLSRSFSMVFYLLLAMAAILRMIYRKQNPDDAAKDPILVRRIWLVIFASVIILYLFVRIRGVR